MTVLIILGLLFLSLIIVVPLLERSKNPFQSGRSSQTKSLDLATCHDTADCSAVPIYVLMMQAGLLTGQSSETSQKHLQSYF